MRRLTLLRHAKSSWDDSVKTDFDRPLNAKGRRAAATMGAYLRRERAAFDIVVASPAMRVRQTIEGVEDGLGRPLGAMFDSRVYQASAAVLIEIVAALAPGCARALLVGHNPGLEDLVMALVPAGGWGAIEEKYPTASVAELDLLVEDWAQVGEGCGRLRRFTRPRDLDPGLGPDAGEGS